MYFVQLLNRMILIFPSADGASLICVSLFAGFPLTHSQMLGLQRPQRLRKIIRTHWGLNPVLWVNVESLNNPILSCPQDNGFLTLILFQVKHQWCLVVAHHLQGLNMLMTVISTTLQLTGGPSQGRCRLLDIIQV